MGRRVRGEFLESVDVEQIADAVDGDVGGGIFGDVVRIESVMPLARENCRYAFAPTLFDRGQDANLVVDEDIPLGGIAAFDVGKLVFLVNVNEDVAADRLEQARTLDLARLKYNVAIGEDHHFPQRAAVFNNVERIRKQAVSERIVDQIRRNGKQMRIVRVPQPIPLQCPKIIGIAKLVTEFFENIPVNLAPRRADLFVQKLTQVLSHAVVVEQGVVDVEEENCLHSGNIVQKIRQYIRLLFNIRIGSFRMIAVLSLIFASAIAAKAQNKGPKCSDARLRNVMRTIGNDTEFRDRMSDVDIKAQDCKELFEKRYVDLNGDGTPEVLMRGQVTPLCGGVGNCSFYVLTLKGKMLLATTDYVDRSKMGRQAQRHRTHGYLDILLTGHVIAGETMLALSRFNGRKYVESKCPSYEVYDREINGKPHFKMVTCKEYKSRLD